MHSAKFKLKNPLKRHFLVLLSILLVLGWSLSSPADDSNAFRITKAEWKADKREFKVEGRGIKGETVVVKDAGTLAELGTPIVESDGKWQLKLKNPTSIPCSVQAESDSQILQKSVRNSPENCSPEPSPVVTLIGLDLIGPGSIPENTSANYAALATFSDGSTKSVTDSVNWRLADAGFADIESSGMLTAFEVIEDQPETVIASYTHEGVTVESTAAVIITDQSEPLTGSHAGRFVAYEGTRTCLNCHTQQALELHASVHYQWRGDASETIGLIAGDAGKLGGINDFCIYPDINWIGKLTTVDGTEVDGGCAKCHVGLGAKPDPEPTQSQLENIDCLICHSDTYKRKVEMINGSYRFVPDTGKMTVSILQAAADITLPSKDSCLNCHTKAGGGNNLKRGDLAEYHRDPPRDFDVHMASASNGGAGLACLDCHAATSHRIAGRGSDLRPRDLSDPVNCTGCHAPSHNEDIRRHTARVNCTVCHIPEFAKATGTDMNRDWSHDGVLVEASGLYEPFHETANNVVPEYRFFNGQSYFYQFGDPIEVEANGRVVMSAPEGSITDPGAKIFAFKHHLATQPVEPNGGRLLPLKIGIFFQTGDFNKAVEQGAIAVNGSYTGHEFVDTERFMGIFHEVAPKEQALSCNDCHNGGKRLDFAALGYTPNTTYNGKPLCASCHGDKSNEWPEEFFKKVHAKHVTDKKLDCNRCHIFTAAAN